LNWEEILTVIVDSGKTAKLPNPEIDGILTFHIANG
jgi:hypothetical protein